MGDKKRVQNCVKYGHIYTAIIMIAGLIAIDILAVAFSNIFELSGETQTLFIGAMKIISVSFVFAGVNIAFQGMFQSMEGGMESLAISICRQVVFIFPFALIFAKITKSDSAMTWISRITFPIAETLTAVIAVLLFRRICHKNRKNFSPRT